MKLYFAPGASSLSAHIVLREAGVPFEPVRVDLQTKRTETGLDFTRFNGKGYVPVLELDDGQQLTEVSAIVQYVAEQNPAANLVPSQGLARYRVQEWLSFVSSELHKLFVLLSDPQLSQDARRSLTDRLGKRFEWLSEQLKARNGYLLDAGFTVADAYLFTVLSWPALFKMDLSAWPVLGQYSARVAERPKVKEALRAEGLLK